MARYVAFLRGVSPTNAKMPALARCFELAGFTDVKTVLSSGNVVFASQIRSVAEMERKAEATMAKFWKRYSIERRSDTGMPSRLSASMSFGMSSAPGL